MPDPPFIPGRELSRAFYAEVVRPRLAGRAHSAALLGWGSDVLGYDSARSTDHGWGPRVLVFVEDRGLAGEVRGALDEALPERFRGWPVRYGWDGVEARHWVTVTTLPDWLQDFVGVDATAGMTDLDWLLTPQQRLLGVVAGAVHADHGGALERVRRALAWYPDGLWRWLLACQWQRLGHEEALVARTADAGDELGSAVAAARAAREVMRLALLLDRRYAPYQKWLGTAFARGDQGDRLPEHLRSALGARDTGAREAALARAYEALARRHNRAGLTPPLDPSVRDYHRRPARVLMAGRFASALLEGVTDPALLALPLIGSVDQVADSTDVLQAPAAYRRLGALYPGVSRTLAPGGAG
jgi:uncharacterized protein DUF4037